MNLSIWTSWTKSWITLVHQVFNNIHYLWWTVLMNSSWTQFMNWLDEPLMNVHECSWTFINVHHLMSFISGVTGCDISFGFREKSFSIEFEHITLHLEISSSTWVLRHRRQIWLPTGVLDLVCLPLSMSRLWELRRSRATTAIIFVSVRSRTYVTSFG